MFNSPDKIRAEYIEAFSILQVRFPDVVVGGGTERVEGVSLDPIPSGFDALLFDEMTVLPSVESRYTPKAIAIITRIRTSAETPREIALL